MTIVLFSLLAFAVTALLYWMWTNVFGSRNKAKKERLLAIHAAVHASDPRLDNALSYQTENEFETWLRSHLRIFTALEMLIRRAHIRLTVGSLAGLMTALFLASMLLGLLIQITPWLLVTLAFASAGAPVLWLSRKAEKRGQAFGNKLPETLDYIARALRSSHSLNMAISMVGKEFPDPVGTEFKMVADKINFGIPFKDAISQLSDGVKSRDLNFFVVSILIQHETGGNLAELLGGLAHTMRERIKLRGKIRTLSSEGRASAFVLGSLPFAITAILSITNPDYISILWNTEKGQNLILIASLLMGAGLFVLKRLVKIKV